METKQVKPSFEDRRGIIKDILVNEPIEHVTVITSKRGAVRGNHYHKETIQWMYIHSGRLEYLAQKGNEKIASHILEAGDLVKTETFEKHAFKSLEDSIFYVFTRGPKVEGDHISDTYRLTTPLHDLLERQ